MVGRSPLRPSAPSVLLTWSALCASTVAAGRTVSVRQPPLSHAVIRPAASAVRRASWCPARSGARIDIQGGIALERKCALVRLTLVGLASISNSARLMYALPVDVARLKRLIHINSRWLPCRTTLLFHADRIIDSLVRCSLWGRLQLWKVLARTVLHDLPADRFTRGRWTHTRAECLDP